MRPFTVFSLPIVLWCTLTVHGGDKKKFPDPTPRKEAILKRCAEEFVTLTPGQGKFPASFVMGTDSGPASEQPAHKVALKQPFAIGKYEVTQELYHVVMGKNPARWQGLRNSVEMVTWDDAVTFCRRLTKELRQRKLIDADETIRLPSEAEWEYACRAGTTTAFSFGDNAADLGDYSWHKDNSKGYDPPVGKKQPNPWGLYDMHGYVSEWCLDAAHLDYKGAPTDGSAWTNARATERVIRGGSFADAADLQRRAARTFVPANKRSDRVGFRLCRLRVGGSPPPAAKPQAGGVDDWPQFLGPTRNGVSAEKGLAASWPKDGPPVVWQRDVGEGYSGPVIAGERLILFHRVADKEVVECLNAATGKPLWKHAYRTSYADMLGKGDGPRSTPVIAAGRVVTLGAAGTLTCLDLEKGTPLFSRPLNTDYRVPGSYFGVGTSPLVDGDRILVNVGGKNAGIVAFALADGKEIWKATTDGASYSSPVIATVGKERLAVFFTRFGVELLDAKTGAVRFRQRWRARYDTSVNAATPLVIGDRLFFSTCYETGALLLELQADGTAKELWHGQDVLDCHYNTPVYHDGHLYGIHGRQDVRPGPDFRCVDLKTKKIAWQQPRYGCASLILADGKLIALTERGDLVLVDATPAAYRELARRMCSTRRLAVPRSRWRAAGFMDAISGS